MEILPIWDNSKRGIHIRGNWLIVLINYRTYYIFYDNIYQTWRATISTAKKYTYENGPLDNPPNLGRR